MGNIPASALCLLALLSGASPASRAAPENTGAGAVRLPSGGTLTLTSSGEADATTIVIAGRLHDGATIQGELDRDETVAPHPVVLGYHLVGEFAGHVLILTDSYPSKPGGLSYCQAGRERFLRVLLLAERQVRQTLRLKLESCRDNVELAEDGLRWVDATGTLSIDWLSAPGTRQVATSQTYHIATTGAAELVAAR